MDRTGNGTVGKALGLLDLVAKADKPIRFSELQGQSGLPKATLHRFLRVLCDERMLVMDSERRTYRPGLRLVRLAHAAWQQSTLAEIARTHLDSLADSVRETIHLAQLDNGQVLYVDKRNAVPLIEMYSRAGRVVPAYCTGIGKVMLAFLDKPRQSRVVNQQSFFAYTPNTLVTPEQLQDELDGIRSRGYAFDDEEHEPSIICIACPIRAGTRLVGGLSITSSVNRHSLDSLLDYKIQLLQTARNVGKEAAVWQFPTSA